MQWQVLWVMLQCNITGSESVTPDPTLPKKPQVAARRAAATPGNGSVTGSKPAHLPTDGWLGTRELPGYRAGNVVARLSDLPSVDPEHLYFNLLLLGADGQLQDLYCGPCQSVNRQQTIDDRSRYVRVVAELVRHAPSDDRGLSAIGQALGFVRERGILGDRLLLAAQLLDDASSEAAVAANLLHLLTLSVGADEARREIDSVVADLTHSPTAAPQSTTGSGQACDRPDAHAVPAGHAGLSAQVAWVVHRLGKDKARRYLREKIDLALVPDPGLLGV